MNKTTVNILFFILSLSTFFAEGQDSLFYSNDSIPFSHIPPTQECSLPNDSIPLIKKDTIATPSKPLELYEPDLEGVTFIPKGQWIAGVSISYSQSSQNDYQFLILENVNGDTYSFRVTPMLAFAFANDMAAGGKFAYSRNLTKLEKGSVILDSETDYTIDHLYRLSHNYYGMAIFRNYFSLGHSKRFGFFTELQFQLGGGQSKIMKGKGGDLTGAYERNFSLDLGLAPGLIVFLNNYSALEVNIGVLGFSYNHTKQISDRIYVSNRSAKSANFRINLFSITFGVAFYL
ncbi:MAG: hypothetical protein NC201_05660 [Prevotella sp.]|nr:hypothetical protein [Bacteroides sp.]MCM1366719.1 hypothetical protein [Prevotella sp.]MCM1437267.1 hypothetical protein [Prevotella sp.]